MIKAPLTHRREVTTRQTGFAKFFAKKLASAKITPNQISVLSIVFAVLSFFCFWKAHDDMGFLVMAVIFIQLRLLCNLFDGMLAVEHNQKTSCGELYNEVPDRISDAFIIMGAGIYSYKGAQAIALHLAWACVFLATMTAYIRVLGASLIQKSYFIGPMAKQHRMFVISLAALLSFLIPQALYISLFIMLIGLVITNVRRLRLIAKDL